MTPVRWAALVALALWTSGVQANCRQALALGLDVSGSVDPSEYRLQLNGLASAFLDEEVQAAFLAMPDAPVRLMVFEWSGRKDQRPLIDWIDVDGRARLIDLAARLNLTQSAPVTDPSTAIAAAMIYGAEQLSSQSDCWARTLDLSGDGPANIGRHPGEVASAMLGDVVINGLIIGADARANTTKNLHNVKTLEDYYSSFVLRGPGAFAEVAIDYPDFENAMKRKLIREIGAPALSMKGVRE